MAALLGRDSWAEPGRDQDRLDNGLNNLVAGYFLLNGVMGLFRYLKFGVSLILMYVGFKMIISHWYKIPSVVSLAVIGGTLLVAILASKLIPERPKS